MSDSNPTLLDEDSLIQRLLSLGSHSSHHNHQPYTHNLGLNYILTIQTIPPPLNDTFEAKAILVHTSTPQGGDRGRLCRRSRVRCDTAAINVQSVRTALAHHWLVGVCAASHPLRSSHHTQERLVSITEGYNYSTVKYFQHLLIRFVTSLNPWLMNYFRMFDVYLTALINIIRGYMVARVASTTEYPDLINLCLFGPFIKQL